MSERERQLRQELVDMVERSAPRPRRAPHTFIASIAAFAIAGAITGGTVAAVASSVEQPDEDLLSARFMGLQIIGEHSPVVGEPIDELRTGSSEIQLGFPPEGANAIAFAFHCTSVGTFSFSLNGGPEGTNYCLDESDTRPGHGMSGSFMTPDLNADNILFISADGSAGYAFWAAWVTRPAPQEPSAEQSAALADGVVDEQEYLAGLGRYIECMAEAGFTVDVLDTAGPIVQYVIGNDSVLDGADERCYAAEFRELDMEWQISQQEPGE